MRTLPGAEFLWLVLQHVLPKGLRLACNFGFLHHNCIATVRLMQLLHLRGSSAGVAAASAMSPLPARPVWRCLCGQPMHVVQRRMPAQPNDVNDVDGRMRTSPDGRAVGPVEPVKPDKPEPASARTMH